MLIHPHLQLILLGLSLSVVWSYTLPGQQQQQQQLAPELKQPEESEIGHGILRRYHSDDVNILHVLNIAQVRCGMPHALFLLI